MSSGASKVFTTGVNIIKEVETFQWNIKQFDVIREDESLISKQLIEVEVGKTPNIQTWFIGLRLKSDYICIHLQLLIRSASSNAETKFTFKIEKNNVIQWIKETRRIRSGDNIVVELVLAQQYGDSLENLWDSEKTMRIDIISETTQKLLIDQSETEKDVNKHILMENHKKTFLAKLQRNYAALLENDESSDVKIICMDDTELTAHKLVLTAQCPIFNSMLCPESEFSESQDGVIKIDDVSGPTMKILLHYWYTGELLSGWSDPETILEFTYAAGKYQLGEVLNMVDDMIGRTYCGSTGHLQLLSLVQKLELKKAEAQLVEQIKQLTSAAKTSHDLFAIFDGNN